MPDQPFVSLALHANDVFSWRFCCVSNPFFPIEFVPYKFSLSPTITWSSLIQPPPTHSISLCVLGCAKFFFCYFSFSSVAVLPFGIYLRKLGTYPTFSMRYVLRENTIFTNDFLSVRRNRCRLKRPTHWYIEIKVNWKSVAAIYWHRKKIPNKLLFEYKLIFDDLFSTFSLYLSQHKKNWNNFIWNKKRWRTNIESWQINDFISHSLDKYKYHQKSFMVHNFSTITCWYFQLEIFVDFFSLAETYLR